MLTYPPKSYRPVIIALYPRFTILHFDNPALFIMKVHFDHVLYVLLLVIYMYGKTTYNSRLTIVLPRMKPSIILKCTVDALYDDKKMGVLKSG